jgi:coenzyme F420-reducing hydrogenase alpha subunit
LPELSASQFEALLGGADADAFVAAPQWNGTAAESTPFTRNSGHPAVAGLLDLFGNGLLARLAAQLVELVRLHSQLRQPQDPAEKRTSTSGPGAVAGIGIARVDAARGLLIHRVAVADDEVLGYRILAPTEWNFHPRGPVAAGLAEMRGLDQKNLSRLVRLFVTAVDPCVEYDVIFR